MSRPPEPSRRAYSANACSSAEAVDSNDGQPLKPCCVGEARVPRGASIKFVDDRSGHETVVVSRERREGIQMLRAREVTHGRGVEDYRWQGPAEDNSPFRASGGTTSTVGRSSCPSVPRSSSSVRFSPILPVR